MSLNLDLETWSRVTAHHLPKGTLGVKYKPDLDKGRLIMLRQVKLDRLIAENVHTGIEHAKP